MHVHGAQSHAHQHPLSGDMRGFRWRPQIDEQPLLNHERVFSLSFSAMSTSAMLFSERHLSEHGAGRENSSISAALNVVR